MSDPRRSVVDRADRDEAAWLERVERSWQPEPLDEAGRARFDARLHARLEAPVRRLGWWAPAAMVAAAVLAWALRAPAPEAPRPGASSVAATAAESQLAESQLVVWEWELLLGDELSRDDAESLPEEYSAIASAFQIQ